MSLRKQPYLPLYVQDFMTDERLCECSAEATGVYIRLMCLMHKSEEYGTILLKQKFKQNASTYKNFASKLIAHLPYSEEVICRSLEELVDNNVLTVEGDKILQRRMVRDNLLSEVRSKAGKKGGQKTGICLSKMASKTQATAEYEYANENEGEIESNQLSMDVMFDRFYEAYPRKESRSQAERAFSELMITDALFTQIMTALEKWTKTDRWTKEGGEFVPAPAKWLREGRWEDAIPKASKQNFAGVTYTDEQLSKYEDDPAELVRQMKGEQS